MWCGCTQALRLGAFVTFNLAFVPLVVSLCRVYTCSTGSTWLNTGLVCFGDVHIILTVVVTVVLTVFSSTALMGKRATRLPLVGGSHSPPASHPYLVTVFASPTPPSLPQGRAATCCCTQHIVLVCEVLAAVAAAGRVGGDSVSRATVWYFAHGRGDLVAVVVLQQMLRCATAG